MGSLQRQVAFFCLDIDEPEEDVPKKPPKNVGQVDTPALREGRIFVRIWNRWFWGIFIPKIASN